MLNLGLNERNSALTDAGLWDEVADRLSVPALSLLDGQQQSLCNAGALVLQPEVLLINELCSALAPTPSRTVEERMGTLVEFGRTREFID